MTIFSWFNKNAADRDSAPDSSGLSRVEPTRPVGGARDAKDSPAGNAQPANRKSERMARRELLYSVVRECMTRAGVLTASYKFKVLSLDARGRQFLVMVDLASTPGFDAPRFGEVEAMIAQGAKNRHDIIVTAVYWRMHDHVAIGTTGLAPAASVAPAAVSPAAAASAAPPARVLPPLGASVARAPGAARPDASAPVVPNAPASAALVQPVAAAAAAARPTRSNAEEVAEFRRALAAGLARPAAAGAAAGAVSPAITASGAAAKPAGTSEAGAPVARSFDGAAVQGPQSYTLLTGFEDTELGETKVKLRSLSGSQFGDLN